MCKTWLALKRKHEVKFLGRSANIGMIMMVTLSQNDFSGTPSTVLGVGTKPIHSPEQVWSCQLSLLFIHFTDMEEDRHLKCRTTLPINVPSEESRCWRLENQESKDPRKTVSLQKKGPLSYVVVLISCCCCHGFFIFIKCVPCFVTWLAFRCFL